MKLPFRKLKLGPHKWKVKQTKLALPSHSRAAKELRKYGLDDIFFGEITWKDETIRIDKDLKEQVVGEVLLHEILHALFDEINLHSFLKPGTISRSEQEEFIVQNLAVLLIQVIRDNPKLIEVLRNVKSSK